MKVVVVIPARYGSTRFPGKPLAQILGRSLIARTWDAARAASGVDEVVVATDDQRIADHVAAFGGRVAMTREDCRNGTERVHEALEVLGLAPEIVMNLQGDAVLTPPWAIEAIVEAMQDDATIDIATPAVRMSWEEHDAFVDARRRGEVGGTTVTFDRDGRALYFSKAVIPFVRERKDSCPVFRHVGLYGYTRQALGRYLSLPQSPLEQTEKLEQLRALEHGMRISVVEVDYRGRPHASVDNPGDITIVEDILQR